MGAQKERKEEANLVDHGGLKWTRPWNDGASEMDDWRPRYEEEK